MVGRWQDARGGWGGKALISLPSPVTKCRFQDSKAPAKVSKAVSAAVQKCLIRGSLSQNADFQIPKRLCKDRQCCQSDVLRMIENRGLKDGCPTNHH